MDSYDLQGRNQKMKRQKHNRETFSALIEKHQAIIHKISFIYSDGAEDRKDLFQEICLQLWKAYPKFREDAKFSTWMYRVALNTAISNVRKNRNKPNFETINEKNQIVDHSYEEAGQVKLLYLGISKLNQIDKALNLINDTLPKLKNKQALLQKQKFILKLSIGTLIIFIILIILFLNCKFNK